MISINGNIFLGNNSTIINGQVISGSGFGKPQKFNERKSEDCTNIEKITINSTFCNVNVSVSNSSKVEAHLYGDANVDGEINFDVRVVNRELIITLEFKGKRFIGNLKLDVTVPQKTFKVISANSSSTDFTLNKGVSTDCLIVQTQSGDLETNATLNSCIISTMSGDVEFCIDAVQDIHVKVSTMSGNVSTKFNNIGHINLYTHSVSGKTRNYRKESGGYNADVNISTISGNIRIS